MTSDSDEMTRTPLFDDRPHDDAALSRFDETLYAFLDRVDDVYFGRVRDLLNDWFTELGDDATAERMRRDFASRREEQVEGAFWELYLHAALTRTPLGVELEPGRDLGRQPDFRAWPLEDETHDLFIEARAIGDTPGQRARRRRLKRVWQTVNEAPPMGFHIFLGRVTPGVGSPSGARLRRQIVAWLTTLDRASLRAAVESGDQTLEEARFTVADWSFDVRAWPLAEGVVPRSLIAIEPLRMGYGGSRETLAGALKKKSARYELGDRPFVIAVGNVHSLADDEDVANALYGDYGERVLGEDEHGQFLTEPTRHHNGFFGQRNRRVSGLLHALRIVPWSVGNVVPELWVNPFARAPLSMRFRWARTIEVADDGRFVVTEPTMSQRELFGLTADWPGPEEPFEQRLSES
jgi:hypothetical protein